MCIHYPLQKIELNVYKKILLTNNLIHFISDNNSTTKKRWEIISRGQNNLLENIVMEELYDNQDKWQNFKIYEEEIINELVSELCSEMLQESCDNISIS